MRSVLETFPGMEDANIKPFASHRRLRPCGLVRESWEESHTLQQCHFRCRCQVGRHCAWIGRLGRRRFLDRRVITLGPYSKSHAARAYREGTTELPQPE